MDPRDAIAKMIAAAKRDPKLLDDLLRYYRPILRLIAEQLIGDRLRRREDASDIVQRTLLEANQGFGRFSGESEPELSAWLKQILCHNAAQLARDHQAGKRDVRREFYVDGADGSVSISWFGPGSSNSTPARRAIKAEEALKLATAIESLPLEQRLAVKMRHLDSAGMAEIAEAMGKSKQSVAGLLRRGLASLHEKLKPDAISAETD